MAEEGVGDSGAENLSATDDEHVGPSDVPLLKWLNVSIKETEKRATTTLKIQDSYVVYSVDVSIRDPAAVPPAFKLEPNQTNVWRRYSDFELLRQYLIVTYPSIVIPPLPGKRTGTSMLQRLMGDKYDPEFVERRRAGLEQFMLRVCAQGVLSKDKYVLEFLRQEVDWKDSVTSTNFQAKADSKIKALSASYRVKHTDERFEQLRSYSHQLELHTASVLKIRESAADHVYGTHKIHTNYGRLLSELSRLEKDNVADALQKAGHFMDVYAQSIDVFLESEEDFADQLREYNGFGDSLRTVCRKHDLLQFQVEQAEDALTAKRAERTQVYEGKAGILTGFRAKVFGAPASEQKEEKLRQLDEQILEGEETVATLKADLAKFVEDTLANVDKFQRQKVKDVKDILLNFALQQIERCKKGKATWENLKQSFDAI